MLQRYRRARSFSRLSLLALLCFAYLAAPPFIFAQQQSNAAKRPVTHEDVWLAKRVGAPVPSPDGRWLVFSLIEPAYDEKDQVSDLWIMALDGSSASPRRLTFSKSGESDLAWSPDSQRLAFAAKREGDEVNQIYVLNVADGGGEAVKFTSLSTGARAPRWRPDGQALLFVSNVYPGAADDEANKKIAAERKARKYKARVYEGFPIRYWDKWLEETQPHIFTQSDEPGAQAKDLLAGTELIAARGFGGRQTDTGEVIDAVWTPDGRGVIFAATTGRDSAAYARYNTHLYLLSVTGGAPQQLTQGADNFARPRFSPDGKTLACVYTHTGEKLYSLDRLALFSWPSTKAQPSIVTDKFDRSLGNFAFAPDSKSVYFTAEDAGHENIYQVPVAGGEVRLVVAAAQGVYTNLAIPEKTSRTVLLANWESATNPSEVVRLDTSAKSHQVLTRFNAERAAAIDWQQLQHFWFTGKRGQKIHSMFALPPNFDENRKYPLFVLMHGGPHTMWRDQFFVRWNYHLLARPGYVVLLTNYTGSTGFGESFAQGIQGDPLAGPAEEINAAADEAIRRYNFIDGTRQAAGGASYGGHLANWMQATTTRYKCLISHAGLINLESQWGTSDTIYSRELSNGGPVWEQGGVWREQNPIRFAKNFRTPILITVGENDFRVPLNQSLENWSVLQRLRIPSRLIVFPDENHWIQKGENSRFFYQEVHQWLGKHLLAESPAAPATSSR